MSGRGRTLRTQAQELVLNLLQYFEQEKAGGPLISLTSVQQRVADALQVGIATVKWIKARSVNNPVVSSPGKKRPRIKRKTDNLAECSKMSIRNTLYTMYLQRKHVTLQTLNAEIAENHILLSTSSLNRVLHNIGFKFKIVNNRRALVERSNITEMRLLFLKKYLKNINSPFQREVIFLDETWIFSKGNPSRSWQDDNVQSVRKPEGYDGKRHIIVHAGSKSGFVPNASLVFASKSQREDYHGEMNGEKFKKWIKEYLICNLAEPALILMDNAPYHSQLVEKHPTSAWCKKDIITYLSKRNIHCDPTLFKNELLTLTKNLKEEKRYEIDELLQSHGHEVLRLPPYHCEFNAIEMIWAHAKQYYNKHIGRDGYGHDKVNAMWKESLEQCTDEIWKNCINHTEKIIQDWYDRESRIDCEMDDFVTNVSDSSSSSDNEDSDTNDIQKPF